MTWRQQTQESAESIQKVQNLNPEYMQTVLELLRQGKTEKQIALTTQKHRTTVSRYVKQLRQNTKYDFPLLVNQILSKLQSRIDQMSDRDLISFLDKLLPDEPTVEHTGKIEVVAPWLNVFPNTTLQSTTTDPTTDK